MSITLNKVAKITDKPETNDIFINTLSWFENNKVKIDDVTINSFQLTPYYLKNEKGQIFENIWQYSKLYPKVFEQKEIKAGKLIWSHPFEKHVIDGELQSCYWEWRRRGLNNPYPVRYPNGYNGRHTCLFSLWKINGEWECLKYIEARKEIYIKEYNRLIVKTEAFQKLKTLIAKGCNLSFIDVDVPGKIVVNQENYNKYLEDPTQAFGHTWVLAGCLLNLKLT